MMDKYKKLNIGFICYIILVFVLLISALLVSILIGEEKISFSTIMDAIFNYNPKNQQHNIIIEI
ncbi:iron ABC transporter permease, partial [Staphylococcus haemolyticus]